MSNLRWIGLAVLGVALILAILVQFLPWKYVAVTIGGRAETYEQDLWYQRSLTRDELGALQTTQGYFSSELDDHDPWLARLGGPVVSLATAGMVAAGVVGFLRRGGLAGAIALGSGTLLAVAAIGFFIGLAYVEPSEPIDYPTMGLGKSIYLVYPAALLAAVAGLLLASEKPEEEAKEEPWPNVADRPRNMKCPSCSMVSLIPPGELPVCPECGFGSRNLGVA